MGLIHPASLPLHQGRGLLEHRILLHTCSRWALGQRLASAQGFPTGRIACRELSAQGMDGSTGGANAWDIAEPTHLGAATI